MHHSVLIFFLCFLVSCRDTSDEKIINDGKRLAEKHCSSCHQFPDPELLTKKTWVNFILPRMAVFSGFRQFESVSYFEDESRPATMSLEEWNKIVRYYVRMSPKDPEPRRTPDAEITTSLKQFRRRTLEFHTNPRLTSYLGIFPGNRIIFGDGVSKNFYLLKNEQLVDSFILETGISQVWMHDNKITGLAMGVMYPSDIKRGKLKTYTGDSAKTILDSLQRPVFAEFAHLNNDTLTDIIISEFGNTSGQLAWFENLDNDKYLKHTLRPLPGAVKTITKDFNDDGRNDIMAMMAQGDEGVFIYYNEGKNRFREHRILQFSPAFGSNYFELADLNADGHEDIVATNGDNGDYPAILKPYHGIRVYENTGKNEFEEKLFLPVNGVCKAMARDFDADGDIDLASIAYFPDFEHNPYESFIYWENKGDWRFDPQSFPEATRGRWLVMDAGDVDADGDADIVLGHAGMSMGKIPDSLMKKWKADSLSVMLLENILNEKTN